MRPSWEFVWALKPLQNSMMLTPCWPRAGPTGGDGLALPAGICSLMRPVIFFIGVPLGLLYLNEIQLDRGGAAEDADEHADLLLLGLHFLDDAGEVGEGA